jgi:16S rRNA (uracil1498-N3)-methyltransferase
VAVGPEGGWTSEEIDAAARAGVRPIHLGPRILRTETAGVVAVALVMFLAGELDSRK